MTRLDADDESELTRVGASQIAVGSRAKVNNKIFRAWLFILVQQFFQSSRSNTNTTTVPDSTFEI